MIEHNTATSGLKKDGNDGVRQSCPRQLRASGRLVIMWFKEGRTELKKSSACQSVLIKETYLPDDV
jgi:hypothetical protein